MSPRASKQPSSGGEDVVAPDPVGGEVLAQHRTSDTAASFTTVLGSGRGGGEPDEIDPREATPRDRARAFFAWFNRDAFAEDDGDRLKLLRQERAKALELSIVALHGHWREIGKDEPGLAQTISLVVDGRTGLRIGIIVMSKPGRGRLYLEDETPGRRP